MKTLAILLPILFVAPSCETVRAALAVPVAAVHDVSGAVDVVTPGESAAAETAGTVANTTTTIATGNPALGAAVGAAVTAAAAWLFSRRRKPAAA